MLTAKEVAILLDSEGTICITLANLGSRLIPSVQVEMTDSRYPKLMHEQFGGYLYLNPKSKRNPKHSDTWSWQLKARDCEQVLIYALPELTIKKTQAEALLLFITTLPPKGRRPKLTDKQLLLQLTLHELVRKLNKKGPTVNDVIEQLEEQEF